jgi:thiol:disulfide interchange protein DsbA
MRIGVAMSNRIRVLVFALLAFASVARAELAAGRDYAVLGAAQHTDSPGRIEVIEFFSYGCPHCNDLHPLISKWSAKLPKDVVFKRVAISVGYPAWANLARAYYALESTGDAARLDDALFNALHKQRLRLVDEKSIAAWAGSQGVDPGRFSAAYHSFSVDTRVSRAEQVAMDYRVSGLPTLVVAGKFVALGRTHPDTLRIVDGLIALARAENSR